MGVPVKPKNTARGNVSLMVASMSPKVERWASSTMKTIRLWLISSMSAALRSFSALARLIFCIDVTMREARGSELLSFVMRSSVLVVSWTSSDSSANPLYSMRDWVPSSIRSMRKMTLSASCDVAMSWADLKLVMVFPDPVVCQMYPPRWSFWSQSMRATLSEMRLAA